MQLTVSSSPLIPRIPDLFAVRWDKTAGVYHFGLECPSGKLSGFLTFVENQAFDWETAN
jgi:hypothetical protein